MHYLNILLAYINQYPLLAYSTVLLVSFSESLALVGLLVPGTVIMFWRRSRSSNRQPIAFACSGMGHYRCHCR